MSKSRIARVNSTGRKKIAKKYIDLDIIDGDSRSFKIQYHFPAEKFPPESEVILEVFSAGASQVSRFLLGTAARQVLFEGKLGEFSSKRPLFNLKVVKADDKFHHVLGLAEHIQNPKNANTGAGEIPLLAIERKNLGNRLWKLETSGDELLLIVNDRIPEYGNAVRDPKIAAVLYPALLRDGLLKALGEFLPNEEGEEPEDEGEKWQNRWIRFGVSLHPDHLEPPVFSNGFIEYEAADEWIEPILDHFSQIHRFIDGFGSTEGEDGV